MKRHPIEAVQNENGTVQIIRHTSDNMDRIETYLGFSSLEHVVGSIIKYKKLNDPPFVPRVDYTELYKIIQKRYFGSLDVQMP